MKKFLILLTCTFLVSCASVRAPYRMTVSDFSGNSRPYYLEGEALNLHVYWDANRDTGKAVDCSFVNSFSGEIAWRGILIIPESKPGQLMSTVWNPPFPVSGLKLESGSYLAVCSFNNEAKPSIPINVVKTGNTSEK